MLSCALCPRPCDGELSKLSVHYCTVALLHCTPRQVHFTAKKKSAAKHDKTLAASGQVLKAAEKRVVKEAAKVRPVCLWS